MSNNTLTIVAAIVGALGGLSGLAAVITAMTKRTTVNADAEVRLSDEARQWVEQFQQDAKEAKQEAKDARIEAIAARREATEAHAQMRLIRSEAEWLAHRLQDLHRAIIDPNATLERLRAMVGPDTENNSHT
jgi:uncharacterized protein (DUF3084 family)